MVEHIKHRRLIALVAILTWVPLALPAAGATSVVENEFDVIVVGDGLGGVGAAVQAARLGAHVAFFTFTSYPGGQASAGGVSTLDEGSPLLRRSGLYAELVERVTAAHGGNALGGCYFESTTLCPQPDLVQHTAQAMLDEAGVVTRRYQYIDGVIQSGNTVQGVIIDGARHTAAVVVDATERSELYPHVIGLDWMVGGTGCVQDMTWPAVLSWYPDGAPPELEVPYEAARSLMDVWGPATIEQWLAEFRAKVSADQMRDHENGLPPFPWSFTEETRYRAVSDIRALPEEAPRPSRMVINLANDSPLPIDLLIEDDRAGWEGAFRRALHRTYLYMWYVRWEIGAERWGIANDLGYPQAFHLDFDEAIPNQIEANFPPLPYLREGRRLVDDAMTYGDISDRARGTDRFARSVMLGAYYTDFHGCSVAPTELSDYGLYEVPIDVFVPHEVEGFLPGLARAGRVDRAVASSLRMQPTELLGGQVAGTMAGLAVRRGVHPRQLDVDEVRDTLVAHGALVDMPDPRRVSQPDRPRCRPYPGSCPGQ